jgi:hypothetical protein
MPIWFCANCSTKWGRNVVSTIEQRSPARPFKSDWDECVTVVVPGSVNYFHDRAGLRIAGALNGIGIDADVATLGAASRGGDWCFLINPYEIAFAAGGETAYPQLDGLRRKYRRVVAVLMECADTPWFDMSLDVCRKSGVTRVLDLGFHTQQESIPESIRRDYYFALSGLTETERRAIPFRRSHADRPIPWVFVGHLAPPRLTMVERLLRLADPGGFVYMPNIGPVRERGPHINGEQLLRVLGRSRCQVWCTHHSRFYMESERFRDSLLAGCIPIKLDNTAVTRAQNLPFRYLTLPQDELFANWDQIDSPLTWNRFAADFAALPSLEESLGRALRLIERRESSNGH